MRASAEANAPTGHGRSHRARRVAVIAGAEAIRAGGRVANPPTPASAGYRTFAPSRLGDVDTLHEDSRGAKRIVYSNDGLIYYTGDHYESFTLLYGNP